MDERRLEALTRVLLPAAGSRREARNLALLGLTLLVGLQQLRSPVRKRDFDVVFNQYEELLLARLPVGT